MSFHSCCLNSQVRRTSQRSESSHLLGTWLTSVGSNYSLLSSVPSISPLPSEGESNRDAVVQVMAIIIGKSCHSYRATHFV